MIKMFLTDLDGTLLPEGGSKVTLPYFEAIRSFQNQGILFGVSTGRQIANIRRMFDPVFDDMIVIGENGACVLYKGKEIFCAPMSKEDSRGLIEDTRKLPDCLCFHDTRHMCYVESEFMYGLIKNQFGYDVTLVDDLLKVEEPCLKHTVYRESAIEEVTALVFQPKWRKRVDVAGGGSKYLDIVAVGSDKGTSLKRVQKQLGISPEETLVIGDNLNDLGTLALARYSFAVGNAREEVKEACSYLAPDNRHDGVLEVMQALLAGYGQKGEGLGRFKKNGSKPYIFT